MVLVSVTVSLAALIRLSIYATLPPQTFPSSTAPPDSSATDADFVNDSVTDTSSNDGTSTAQVLCKVEETILNVTHPDLTARSYNISITKTCLG
jgi:hypothetical protein